jgi:hypothetical protein
MIDGFASETEQVDVPPSEEPIFVYTGSQLQVVVTKAIQLLKDEIEGLSMPHEISTA